MEKPRLQLIIDTDIGTDPDDAFALTYSIKNPNVDVNAITIVQGIPLARAKIAKKLELLLGVNIPITVGEEGPDYKKWVAGFELEALTMQEFKEPFRNNPFPIYTKDTKLVCIGPLTNIAYQLEKNPSIKNVKEVYIMGCTGDHNIAADTEAAEKVLAEPWNIFQITKQDSLKITFTPEELEKLRGNRIGEFLYESAIRGIRYLKREKTAMYDVLTVSAAMGEDYVKFKQTAKNRFVSDGVDLKLKNRILEVIKE